MSRARVCAALPFPVRVDPTPYTVEFEGAVWTLKFERIERKHPDERVAGAGTHDVDLEIDRAGQLAFSRVTGEATLDLGDKRAFQQFLGVLNLFIAYVRDVLGTYWIRALEPNELYQVVIETDGNASAYMTPGAGGGFTHAVVGLTDEANTRLVAAINSKRPPLVWRQMLLDARDALSVGRDEDCVVLAWSALEAACRQNLPGMAYHAGITIQEFANLLDTPDRKKKPPLSYEEAVGRVSGGLKIVQTAAEFTEPRIYDAQSVRGSVQRAYRLRNKIVHQGVRVHRLDAKRVWDSVDSILQAVLSLREIEPPPATTFWRNRFHQVRPEVERFATSNGLRLILAHQVDSFFDMELIGHELWLRFDNDMPERIAYSLMFAEWESWRRCSLEQRPHLVEGPPSGLLLSGLVSFEAEAVNSAVCYAEALLASTPTFKRALDIAKYGSSRIVADLMAEPRLDPNDARQVLICARLAAYFSVLSKRSISARLRPLRQTQPEVVRLTQRWAELMGGMDPDNEHARCPVLLAIHSDAGWLDTIVVLCPEEGVTYGSRRRPLS